MSYDPKIKKFQRVMAANRGEIAIRIFRSLSELGITTVGVFSKEDKYSLFRTKADEAYMLDPEKTPVGAYLDIDDIIRAAKLRNVDAIHPGYGFLSENPVFVEKCEQNGIKFIGPNKESMEAMGDKLSSKKIAIECNVPTIPGTDYAISDVDQAMEIAEKIGYPIILKASNGGGGRGMRIVNDSGAMSKEFLEAKGEALKAFGDDKIFIEKYLRNPKHVEVQILGDNYGNIVHLFDRDCSVQRRHQKVVEYAPAFSLKDETREKIFRDAVKLAKRVNYVSAGTMEFLIDSDENHYFIEMNPRIQVEHTVTEMITGIDIVQAQVLIAQGYSLHSPEINIPSQEAVQCFGYSIQTRVTTEDPANGFMPDAGRLSVYRSGSGAGIRLDGGNAFTGAEIAPYYDSLLVKLISHDRSFDGAINKSLRALGEMRIRGVKTNIPFLINVLRNKTFRGGTCDTGFIEETPTLFDLRESQDRATKAIEFIGNKIVTAGVKPAFEHAEIPKFDETKPIVGARDEFLKLGAKDFTQKILKDKKLYITETSMRDAHQSLMATRFRTEDIIKIAPAMNRSMAEAFSVECWGGATFDTAYRFLKESPWTRLELLRKKMPNTLIQMLLRASNAVGYTNYPDNVVKEFIKVSAEQGVDVFRIFDSLNWVENMKMPVEEALKTGSIVESAICYTGDCSDPNEKKYTIEYYINKALELEKMGSHIIAVKDMAGLLKPYAAKMLVKALKENLNVPVHVHTHDSTGNGVAAVLMAAEAGVDIVDLAIESMSGLTSQPSLNAVTEALKRSERDTKLDMDELNALSKYFGNVRKVYKDFESDMVTPNTEIYKYEIPGGQYTNLLAQAKEMGSGKEFGLIMQLYKEANDLLGNIVKVTPSSKAVGDLAIFMYKNGLNRDNILTEGASLSYPESVVDYFKGMMGRPDGGFPNELQKIVIKDAKPIDGRPGELLPSVDFEEIKDYLEENFHKGTNPIHILGYAMYPKVYEEYCRHFDQYNDVSVLPSHVFFHGLAPGEETVINVSEGKDLIIKFVDMSRPNNEGKRKLTFEVNGSLREIEIVDKKEVKTEHKMKADKNNSHHLWSSIPGTVSAIMVKEGDSVKVNTPLMIIEVMKMETTLLSKIEGIVDKIYVKEHDGVIQNELLLTFSDK